MGDLFHEALKWITEETHRQQLSWIRLTTRQIKQLARQAVEQIVPVFPIKSYYPVPAIAIFSVS